MARYDSKADFKVHEMKSMGETRDAEAMGLLRRISHQVQPIMRRREWRVPLLSEFFPANPNLLGLNIGGGGGSTREIKIRLRPARDPDSFLPYESVLVTMLHELVHNVRGPHDGAFYKLLDEIRAECEELMARGVGGTGVGFDGPSCGRLGSHAFIPLHNPAPGRLRDYAGKAAEERAKRQRIMPSGPCRLGTGDGGGSSSFGDIPYRYATPAAAAAAAAERRCRDNRWCPCERLAAEISRAAAQAETKRAAPVAVGASAVAAGTRTARDRSAAPVSAAGNRSADGRGVVRGGNGNGSDGGDGSRGGTNGNAVPLASGASSSPAIAPGEPVQQLLTAAEVEADLVRRIEDGLIDLTLDDSDDDDDDSEHVDDVHPAQIGTVETVEIAAGADIHVGTQKKSLDPPPNDPSRDRLREGGPPEWRRRPTGEHGPAAACGGATVGLAGPSSGGSTGGGGRGSGLLRLPAVQHSALFGSAQQQQRQQHCSTPTADVVAAIVAVADHRCPSSGSVPRQPPLAVLQARNPAAAAAATAALARMQQQQQQEPRPRQPEVCSRQGQGHGGTVTAPPSLTFDAGTNSAGVIDLTEDD